MILSTSNWNFFQRTSLAYLDEATVAYTINQDRILVQLISEKTRTPISQVYWKT